MTPMRLSSLIVQAHPTRSPRWAVARDNETAEDIGSVFGLPPSSVGQPGRRREVVECHDGADAAFAAGRADAAVVVERGEGELAFGRLDAAPLQREPVGLEAHGSHELNILGPAVQGITGVATRLGTSRVWVVLPGPPVVVDVAALDLMGRGRGAPHESFRECELGLLRCRIRPRAVTVPPRNFDDRRPWNQQWSRAVLRTTMGPSTSGAGFGMKSDGTARDACEHRSPWEICFSRLACARPFAVERTTLHVGVTRSRASTLSVWDEGFAQVLADRRLSVGTRSLQLLPQTACYNWVMIAADIFRPGQWTDFFLLVGTGAVTLTGLVFVAMSLNLKVIAIDATHRYRAINTLTGLALVFMRCALVLMGAQNHRSIGAELFVVSGISAAIFVKGYTKAIRMSDGLRLSRIVGGSLVHLAEMIGAAIFFLGYLPGLYIAAVAMVTNTCYMITAAWLLVIGVFDQKTGSDVIDPGIANAS